MITELRKTKVDFFGTKVALFDLSLTFIGGYIVGKKLGINPIVSIALSIPVGYLTHKAFSVKTPLNDKIDSAINSLP